ncbi:MAG: TauD/TfdA family dioxygenase [Planctomycetota bacterium]
MTDSFTEPQLVDAPNLQSWNAAPFPLAYNGGSGDSGGLPNALVIWLEHNRQMLMQHATKHGAVLFRDFGLDGPDDFDRLIAALEIENFPYRESLSNAVRKNFTDRVFSANEAPSSVKIYLHHEMAQTPLFPSVILFYCDHAAGQGGATPICRSDVLYDAVLESHPNFVEALETKGLKYSNVMPGIDDPESGMGRSWQSTLGVQSKDEAETRLAGLNYSWEWLDGDSLRATTPVLPAVRRLADGRKTLFNQLIAAYAGWSDDRNDPSSAIRLGDESKLDAEAVGSLIDKAYEITYDLEWQTGDAVLIDNTVVMHGRRPFEGTRRVLASLGDKQTHAFA